MTVQWYDSERGRKRLLNERSFLEEQYAGFGLDVFPDGTVYANGVLGPNDTLRGAYEVVLALPPTYGTGAMPRAFVVHPDIEPHAPHIYSDRSLCVDHDGAFTARSSLVTMLSWVVVWLALYEQWKESGARW